MDDHVDDYAAQAARTFEGLALVDRLGHIPPRLAYAGIEAMSADPRTASRFLPELAALPDARGALTRMYDEARMSDATDRMAGAGLEYLQVRRDSRVRGLARRFGMSAEEVSAILDDESEDRASVEARCRFYR